MSGVLPRQTDFLIIGGGVIGIAIARELARQYPDQNIVLIEKEASLAAHASGRNSGIIHAGFYYSSDSFKARFCREGNKALTEYCLGRGLRINRCGKIVVARDESELNGLDELLHRGKVNDVELQEITEYEAKKIEPRVSTCKRAIFSPTTSAVDPVEVVTSLGKDAVSAGVKILLSTKYQSRQGNTMHTSAGSINCGYVINAAGLYADKVARDFGFSEHYRILPFKGVYLYADHGENVRTNIYPVPNLANPFLGVHFTVTTAGRTRIGPTTIPAFWREQYDWYHRFNFGELVDIGWRETTLFLRNDFGFRSLALSEMQKYRRSNLVALASRMIKDIDLARFNRWGKPGIRAQLLDTRTRKMVMDFHIEGDSKSMHVLNAVSPAFTSSIPFAAHIIGQICAKVK